jgi:hypothetical protein
MRRCTSRALARAPFSRTLPSASFVRTCRSCCSHCCSSPRWRATRGAVQVGPCDSLERSRPHPGLLLHRRVGWHVVLLRHAELVSSVVLLVTHVEALPSWVVTSLVSVVVIRAVGCSLSHANRNYSMDSGLRSRRSLGQCPDHLPPRSRDIRRGRVGQHTS